MVSSPKNEKCNKSGTFQSYALSRAESESNFLTFIFFLAQLDIFFYHLIRETTNMFLFVFYFVLFLFFGHLFACRTLIYLRRKT